MMPLQILCPLFAETALFVVATSWSQVTTAIELGRTMRLRVLRILVLTLALSNFAPTFALAQNRRPNCFFIAAGVDQYTHPKVNDLKGCVNDARYAAQFFQSQAGKMFGTSNGVTLVDAQATKGAIASWMQRAESFGQSGDSVVLFISGHAGGNWEFLPSDYDPKRRHATLLTDEEILSWADRLASRGRKVWIIVDACFAGKLRVNGQSLLAKYTNPNGGGILLLLSSLADQTSTALGQYSAFAHALDEGLKGSADVNTDGRVSLQEVRQYVKGRLPALSKQQADIAASPSITQSATVAQLIKVPAAGPTQGVSNARNTVVARLSTSSKSYQASLKAGKSYRVNLDSKDFDPQLRIENAHGQVLARNGGTGAPLTFTPTTDGTYRFVTTAARTGATGQFTLSVRPR